MMKSMPFISLSLFMLSCSPAEKDSDLADLSQPTPLQSPETILEFDDRYPTSIKVVDSLLFVIYVKADTCMDVFNIRTRQKVESLGRIGHGPGDLTSLNFILSADDDRVLLDEGNLKKILEIKHDADGMRLEEYVPYPDSITISSETNLSENYIVGRMVGGNSKELFYVYDRVADRISGTSCPFDLEEPVSDYNYAFASTVTFNERQNRVVAGMYFFDMVHIYDLEGKHIRTWRLSENCAPGVNKRTKSLELGEGYSGIVRCFPTEKHCYLLRMTRSPKESPVMMLVQMDWEGNVVNAYRFADAVSGQFCVDEETHKIYIIRNSVNEDKGEMFDVVSYSLV